MVYVDIENIEKWLTMDQLNVLMETVADGLDQHKELDKGFTYMIIQNNDLLAYKYTYLEFAFVKIDDKVQDIVLCLMILDNEISDTILDKISNIKKHKK